MKVKEIKIQKAKISYKITMRCNRLSKEYKEIKLNRFKGKSKYIIHENKN